jgi:hypothetical protein
MYHPFKMTVILVFWLFASICCGYGLIFGERDGRLAAFMVAVAAMLSWLAQSVQQEWKVINLPVMLVDVLLWIGLLTLMIRSRRYWPIWMAAAQSLTVASHLATLIVPTFAQKSYAGLATVWAIPCLLCMVCGIALDRHAMAQRGCR